MKLFVISLTMVALWAGAGVCQTTQPPVFDWDTVVGPDAAFNAWNLPGPCTMPGDRTPNDLFMPPGLRLGGPHDNYIAEFPRLRYSSDLDDPVMTTDVDVYRTMTQLWARTCRLAGNEIRGSIQRFSLCNATPTGVEVEIVRGEGSLEIVLGPNSFILLHAQDNGRVRVGAQSTSTLYAVENGKVYALRGSLNGQIVLNQLRPDAQ